MNCAWKELCGILPSWLRTEVDRQYAETLLEIRLRLGKPVQLILKNSSRFLHSAVSREDINYVINTACRYSPWTAAGASQSYITAPGGHRIGICGEATVQNGAMTGFRTITSVNIRVARDFPGFAGSLGELKGSILILGRPGSGKTTLLRDLLRALSNKETVGVVDQRGELFPQGPNGFYFHTGQALDVLSGCKKAEGLQTLVRTMGPDTVAADEITDPEDCQALVQAGWCGVRLIATAHAANRREWMQRPVYRHLRESGLIEHLVLLQPDKTWKAERVSI